MALQKYGAPFYFTSKSKKTAQIALQEVCQLKSWTKAGGYLFMTSGVTTQVPSTTSNASPRGLFYVFSALRKTTSWKQSSNTESIKRLGESPLSLTLCWKCRICRHRFFSVHAACLGLAITAVLRPQGMYNHLKGREWDMLYNYASLTEKQM